MITIHDESSEFSPVQDHFVTCVSGRVKSLLKSEQSNIDYLLFYLADFELDNFCLTIYSVRNHPNKKARRKKVLESSSNSYADEYVKIWTHLHGKDYTRNCVFGESSDDRELLSEIKKGLDDEYDLLEELWSLIIFSLKSIKSQVDRFSDLPWIINGEDHEFCGYWELGTKELNTNGEAEDYFFEILSNKLNEG